MKKVLITGHLGFVGTETVKLFQEKGLQVVGFDIMEGNDIRNLQQLNQFVSEHKPDRILHLAAIARFDEADADPILTHETNVIGTMNVVQVARAHGIPLVFASTGSSYMPIKGVPPISVYGCSKALSELYVRQLKPHIVLRYAHLYGAEKRHHGLIGGFLARISHDLEPVLYGGKQSNDFTYIKDVARANYLAVTAPWDAWNQCYNIGTGEELTAKDAGDIICKFAGYKGEIKVKDGRTVDPERFVFDVRKAERMLKFKAEYTFAQGLEDMFKDVGTANPVQAIPSPINVKTPVA
jgi:nucleoside-diphosphate-sugar epimerase